MPMTADARSADPQKSTRGDRSFARSKRLAQRPRLAPSRKEDYPMLAALETDDLKTVREHERLRIEATRQNDADVACAVASRPADLRQQRGRGLRQGTLSSKHPHVP